MLELSGLSKRFGSLQALDDLSLSLDRGEIVGFVGSNGAGKSTTMRIVMGVLAADSGAVTWMGAPVDAAIRRTIGYMPEERGLYPRMKVAEQLVYLARLHGLSASAAKAAAERWTERLGLEGRRGDEVQSLSLGNQQRVQLAAALVSDPELLILDEPFSGLDPVAVDVMSQVLLERASAGVPTLFSSHQLDVVERLCDRVVIIRSGRLVADGTIPELQATETPRWRVVVEQAAGSPPVEAASLNLPAPTVELDDAGRLVITAAGADEQALLSAAQRPGDGARARPGAPPAHRDLPRGSDHHLPRGTRRQQRDEGGALMSDRTTPITRRQEIALVTGRELRAHLLKKSTIILTLVLLIAAVGGIVGVKLYTSGQDQAYRIGLKGMSLSQAAGLDKAAASNGETIELVDVSAHQAKDVLADDAPEGTPHVDMVLDVSGSTPTITVDKSADDAVVSGVTAFLQQSALGQQIASLGGDPAQVASQLSAAKPEVTVLHAPQRDSADFGSRYAILMTIDILLLFAIMGGGQFIAQGVVEEKSSRIVEILLACVRPSSLLAGKILGIGIASVLTTGAVAVAGVIAAKATGVMPDISLNLDGVLVAMIVWMIVGYAIFAVAFGAAASLVSRQEDVSSVSMPLVMLSMVPYVLSFLMATGDTNSMTFRVLSYVPPFAPFMMPARLVLGVSSWTEQLIALGLALVFLPLLVRVAAAIYTRAVTRTGARVPLKEVLRRAEQA